MRGELPDGEAQISDGCLSVGGGWERGCDVL